MGIDSKMSFYEHTLVAKQDLSTAEIDKVQAKYNDIINSSSGKVVKIEQWGFDPPCSG